MIQKIPNYVSSLMELVQMCHTRLFYITRFIYMFSQRLIIVVAYYLKGKIIESMNENEILVGFRAK